MKFVISQTKCLDKGLSIAHRIMKFIDALMTEFNFDKSLFSISIIAEEEDLEDQVGES